MGNFRLPSFATYLGRSSYQEVSLEQDAQFPLNFGGYCAKSTVSADGGEPIRMVASRFLDISNAEKGPGVNAWQAVERGRGWIRLSISTQ
jgi:hypothetical protein